jgi:endoglucanase
MRSIRLLAALALALGGLLTAPASAVAAAPACQVTYTVTNDWSTGFQGSIAVTNNGAALSSWTLGFKFPGNQQVSSGWNGTWTQSGQNVSVANASWNGALGTGGSVTLGFTATYSGSNAVPTAFTLNGVACNGGPVSTGPSVSITSPSAGQTFSAPANIAIDASASESGGSISKVEFFSGTTLLGTATTSPYSVTWSNVAGGSYSLTAEAFDAAGNTATSAAVPVTVGSGGNTGPAPQLHVSGNQLVDSTGKAVVLHGVNRSGGEFACVQGNGIWNGPMDQASVTAIKSWGVTAVRVPLNEACWNAESYVASAYAGATYQQAVTQYVNLLNSNGIVAILDLHWTDGVYTGPSSGCSSAQATCQKPMPDAAQAIPFWTSVASTFKGNNAVVFDLFNEPYASRATGDDTSGWKCWRDGGTCAGIGYQVAGMQAMVNAVRSTGATNVLMLGGEEYSNELTQWLAYEPTDPDGNLVASWHSYNFNTCANQSCWTSQIAPVIAKVPLIAGEMGENDCADGYVNSLMSWLDSEHTGYLAWTWNNWDCSSGPSLITDYTGTPTAYGAGVKTHLLSLG